jgi:hypothetical protein
VPPLLKLGLLPFLIRLVFVRLRLMCSPWRTSLQNFLYFFCMRSGYFGELWSVFQDVRMCTQGRILGKTNTLGDRRVRHCRICLIMEPDTAFSLKKSENATLGVWTRYRTADSPRLRRVGSIHGGFLGYELGEPKPWTWWQSR